MKNKKFGYKVEIASICTNSEYSIEESSEWSESFDNFFKKITKTKKYPDIVSDVDFNIGHPVYLVWIEYSTGDSFGYSSRGRTESIGIFTDKQTANELIKALEDFNKKIENYDDKYKFYCKTSDGQEFLYQHAPWAGYFEYLDEIHCEHTVISEE